MLLVNVAFWILFAFMADGFLTEFNLFTLLRFASIQIVIGLCQMVALSAGEMNLSVGSIGALVVMFTGGLMEMLGLPPLLAVVLGLVLATITGVINGLLVTRTGINSFVITLATSSLFQGIMLITTKADAFDTLPASFVAFGKARLFNLPISPLVVVMLITTGLLVWLYRDTALGREILAVGANRRAAQMSGVPVPRTIVITHILSASLAGVAGIMMAAMLGSAVPVIGKDWLLPSFAAPAVGGTLISGGVVSVFGTLMGGLLIGSINNGVLLLNVSNFWVNFFLGLVLLLAVGLDRLRTIYAERSGVQ